MTKKQRIPKKGDIVCIVSLCPESAWKNIGIEGTVIELLDDPIVVREDWIFFQGRYTDSLDTIYVSANEYEVLF